MKVALCTKRTDLPVGKREDGFNPLPSEAIHNLVIFCEIKDQSTDLVLYRGKLYMNSSEKYADCPMYVEAKCEHAGPQSHATGAREDID